MKFKIEKQELKPLVEREDVVIKITDTEATPSNVQVQEATAKLLNVAKELIIIKKIHQKFGTPDVIVSAYAYKNEKALKKFEPKKKEGKKEKVKEKEEKPEEEKK